MPDPVRLVSRGESSGSPAHEHAIQAILGTERGPGDPIREDDLSILAVVAQAVELGAPVERVVDMVRSFGRIAAKLVDLQRDFVDEILLGPEIAATGSPMVALRNTSQSRHEYRDLGGTLVELLMGRFVDDAIFRNLVQLTETALVAGGLHTAGDEQTVVFVDVSNYTSLSEVHGDRVSAEQAVRLADFVHQLAARNDARLVKTLGDGAMVHAPNANAGLEFALDAVTGADEAGVWPLHAGVNTGAMVRRDGDYYGSAVNIAARVADEATAGEVLATRAVVVAWTGDDVGFVAVGDAELKNVSEPISLFRVVRPNAIDPR